MSVAWVGAGIAAVGVGLSAHNANQQAGAAQDATNAANGAAAQGTAAANRARQDATRELGPYADRGVQANDALARLLGLGGGSGSGGTSRTVARPGANGIVPGDPNDWAAYEAQWRPTTLNNPTSPWHQYRQANMDRPWGQVFHEWSGGQYGAPPQLTPAQIAARDGTEANDDAAPGAQGQGGKSDDPYHTDGKPDPNGAGGYDGVETRTNPNARGFEESAYGTMVADAQATFEDSPWWSIANDEIGTAIDGLDSKYGASGLLLSGGATRARAEVAARLRGEAFDRHYGARTGNFGDYTAGLRDLQSTGLTASSGIASGGQAYANQVADAANSAANTSANASIAGARAQQDAWTNASGLAAWSAGLFAERNRQPTPINTMPANTTGLVATIPRVG